jgi:N-acetyl-1-D-myo-inositol-2-amino-2-deoxy-alpha-D-glucopyranoside deacetylase
VTVVAARLLVVVAHPDDETFGCGSLIALAAQQGVEVTVCCATRGEAGEAPEWLPAGASLATVREQELRAAGELLGVSRFVLLDFADSGMEGALAAGTLAAADEAEVASRVAAVLDEVRPDVVLTLDPSHGDGHRDHVAIGRATTAACAGRAGIRLYYWAVPRDLLSRWFEELARARPDSEHLDLDRQGLGRPTADITTVIDTAALRGLREKAIAAHASQVSPYEGMPDDLRTEFLTADRLVRADPAWSGDLEQTLF